MYLADIIFGDPEWLPHPVRWMGKLIYRIESSWNKKGELWLIKRIKGVILAIIVVGVSSGLVFITLTGANKINPWLYYLFWIYTGYTTIAVKDLRVKAKAIYCALEKDDIFQARKELAKIVGRDTQIMEKEAIIKATIESVAENTNDGIIAPLFYLIIGGPVLAMAYKAINTLDSMVGYQSERYLDFGWFSARADDLANYFPARITGFLIVLSSFLVGKNFFRGFRIMVRDGRKHLSPNSGISEAAMAGALGVKLGGGAFYQGRWISRPEIGEEKRKINAALINEALKISFLASFLMLLIGMGVKWLS